MGRPCTVCRHPNVAEINRRLLMGEGSTVLLRAYGLKEMAILRHRKNHLGVSALTNDDRARLQGGTKGRRQRKPVQVTPTPQSIAAAQQLLPAENLLANLQRVGIDVRAIAQGALQDKLPALALNGFDHERKALVDLIKLSTNHADTVINVGVGVQVGMVLPGLVEAFERVALKYDLPAEAVVELAEAIGGMSAPDPPAS